MVDKWLIDEDIGREVLRRSLRIHKRQKGLPKAKGSLQRGENEVAGGKARPWVKMNWTAKVYLILFGQNGVYNKYRANHSLPRATSPWSICVRAEYCVYCYQRSRHSDTASR